ncbi:MFS transporter [Pseudoroseomonas wenyumeiae]|uniref:MFS transporter n=1 Tax=Teichococcus wenyumeiae TaxID=2478470 RepID=A0A3A9JE44_9PROT|nr:MFS transporter [Pseudoroseomonas wenyumeiae]RMI15155.1 MFS transporter [Pseudoroseomonas wenyumeiae]
MSGTILPRPGYVRDRAAEGRKQTLRVPLWVSALVATLIVQTVSSFSSLAIPLLGPPLMGRAGLPLESIGLVSAMTSAGICWCLACGGPMLAHHGPVRTLQIGLAGMALGLLVLSQPLGLLGLFGALAIGFGAGPNTPAGSQILIRTAPARHRALIFSIKQAGVPLGGALAGLVLAPLVVAQGLTTALWAVIAVTLCTILAVQPFRRRLDGEEGASRPGWARSLLSPTMVLRSVSTLRAHASLPLLTALGASFSVVQACLMAFTATYAVTRHGASLAEAGRIVALMQGCSMLGRILMGWVADRTGHALRHLAWQAVASALAVALLVLASGHAPWALYGCAALVGFVAIGWNGVHMAELARIAPLHLVSDVTSAASLFGFVGSICGPLVFTLLVSWSGSYTLAFLLVAAQLAGFGLVSLISLRSSRQKQTADEAL